MPGLLRRKPSPAMVVALLALFVALSAGAAAISTKAPKNSVVSRSIKNGQVKKADLGRGAVTGAKLADGAVSTAKLATGAVDSSRLAPDSVDGGKVTDGSLGGADIDEASLAGLTAESVQGISFLEARTLTLTDEPEGPTATGALFEIGRVALKASCTLLADSGGEISGAITPLVESEGPLLISRLSDGTESFEALHPESASFLLIKPNQLSKTGAQTSFAVVDPAGTSASGVAAMTLNPDTGECVFHAHAIG